MENKEKNKTIIKRPVYNLEFPPRCPGFSIFGYEFSRVENYGEKVLDLQHLRRSTSEYAIRHNTGTHVHTAMVELPQEQQEAVLEWARRDNTALLDVLLLLSLFTRRDVFAMPHNYEKLDDENKWVIIRDPRVFPSGGTLRNSIPYKKQPIEPEPFGYDIGFEQGLNQVYELIRSDEWQKKYQGGYFLLLAKVAFQLQLLEASFVQCWTIWEHLFSVLNQTSLPNREILRISSIEKISFILTQYALTDVVDSSSRKRIETLAVIRNRLIHFGRFPEHGSVKDDAVLFIRLTEFVIVKTLGLSPNDVFNTMDRLEKFLGNVDKTKPNLTQVADDPASPEGKRRDF